jgi:hypothetical protein
MKSIDLDALSNVALVALTEPIIDGSNFTIDVWGYHGQSAIIDIDEADIHEINITELKIFSHNFLTLKFAVKKYLLKIRNLLLYNCKLSYNGGIEVSNLSIITSNPYTVINSNVAKNLTIKAQITEDEMVIQKLLKSIEIIPGCGEYALNNTTAGISLLQLNNALPNIKWITPVVAWFADSLDISNCKIFPTVEEKDRSRWNVANYDRNSARLISRDNEGQINYGGTPDDQGVLDFLITAKSKNYNIIFYPLIMVDIYKKPWRGHITGCAEDVEAFYTNQYKPFILHYANLVKNVVDAFIIGSELIGLTRIHDAQNFFPFVKKLIELAAEVRQIMGNKVKLTYAADWSEYHTADGTLRPLDELWASHNIDFVGIDAYFPLTRTMKSRSTVDKIKAGWSSGEGIDFWVDSQGVSHSFNNEGWNQWKNLSYWWSNDHYVYDNILGISTKTLWQPKMKPIWFTEFGFPSIDKAANKPNVFYDPKSSDGGQAQYLPSVFL